MKLNIVYWGDDWMALYKDGELVLEDHSLRPDMIFDALGIPTYSIHSFESEDVEEIWNGPPANFENIKFE